MRIEGLCFRNEARKMAADAAGAIKADLERSQPDWEYTRAWTNSSQGKRARALIKKVIGRDMKAVMEYECQNKAACSTKGSEADLFR